MLPTTIDTMNIPALWYPVVQQIQAVTAPPEPTYPDMIYKEFKYMSGASSTVATHTIELLNIEQLGWTPRETLETYLRFSSFAEDWDAPGMEAYDEL